MDIALTLGDPAGIGSEVAVKAIQRLEVAEPFHFHIIGQRINWQHALANWGKNLVAMAEDQWEYKNIYVQLCDPCVNINDQISFGKINPLAGLIAIKSLQKAVELAISKQVAAIVTGPVNKHAIHLAGYQYPGQTEFLAALTQSKSVAMMLIGKKVRVVMVTTHTSLANVAKLLTKEIISEKAQLTHQFLKKLLGIKEPVIAVAGLNPHAGDSQSFGDEEVKIITPAIAELKASGINIEGPFPADSLFPLVFEGKYDAVLTMYHDQGMIPVKIEAFGSAVNTTLGLPFIRTSVDHGTAFDIAGKGIANENSMVAAINLAVQLIHNQPK